MKKLRHATQRRLRAGFTLIEVLISMAIMAFISFAIYSNTTQSFILRDSVEQDGDFYNSVRVALDVVGRDLSSLYTPQAAALPGPLAKAATTQTPGAPGQPPQADAADLGPPTAYWSAPLNKDGVRLSRFQGEQAKVSFIASSNLRLFQDSPESDFAKISYWLEEDKENLQLGRPTGRVLMKQVDTDAFSDVEPTEGPQKFALLRNIKSLEFAFLDGEKDTYDTRWDTESQTHYHVYPALIKVTVEVFLPNSESTFKVTQVYRPELNL